MSLTCHPSWLRMDSSDLDSHLIHGFSDSQESTIVKASRLVMPFLHGTASVWPTHRRIDHATCGSCSIRHNLMHWVHAMRPNNNYYYPLCISVLPFDGNLVGRGSALWSMGQIKKMTLLMLLMRGFRVASVVWLWEFYNIRPDWSTGVTWLGCALKMPSLNDGITTSL